jgi:aminoglycoside phosphotransferase (APT) family kinase protein
MEQSERLDVYLRQALSGPTSPLSIEPIAGGQSNPTYFLTCGDRRMVLRKQPAGALPSAHAIDREYRVIGALAGSNVPVPPLVHYCSNAEIIGTPFYLMERVEGRIFSDPTLPGVSPSDRRAMYLAMADMLARLHAIDWRARRLSGYGRSENFFERQIARWSRQWALSGGPQSTAFDRLLAWLPQNIPPPSPAAVVHGDFRIGNLMFHPDRPEIVAVLDWELSTLGEPAADVAYSALGWHLDDRIGMGMANHDLAALGVPDEREYLERYHAAAVTPVAIASFHTIFSLFRLAVIFEGIAARARRGNASSADAAAVGQGARYLAARAIAALDDA